MTTALSRTSARKQRVDSRPSWIRILATVGMVVGVVAAWFAFAPSQVGGSVSYVLTNGNSMEPNLHSGDLIMVREQSSYHGGDVVAYLNRDLGGAVVLHRIVGIEGDHFVFKGDNNDFVDPYEPTRSELIGRLWLRIPSGGQFLSTVREPRNAALLGSVLAFMVIGGTTATKKRRAAAKGASGQGPSPTIPALAGVGLVLFALLSAIAWRTSETKATTANVPYRETGTFTYSARAPKGPVYQHEIETGDPVFLKLVTDVKVNYEYRLDLDASHNIAGTTAMVAVISQQNGWTRRIRLAPSQSFTGDSAQLSGNLDLERVVKKLHMVEQLTGQEADLYQLDLIAHTEVEGEIQGSRFSDTFDSSLPMQLDDTTVQMAPSDSETADQLSSSRSQSLPVPATRDTQLSLGPLDLSVSSARLVGPIGAGACLLLILVFGIPLLGAYRKDEASRIHARYGPLLVPMRSVSGIEGAMAEVDDMEALVRIADRYDRLVLHENREGVHRYIVEGDGVVYVYRAKEEASA